MIEMPICPLMFIRANAVIPVSGARFGQADALPDPDCRRRVADVGRDFARYARI
jgi:hypothetical protein